MATTVESTIPLKDALQMYFERSAAVGTFWSFEILVVVGVLTVICTSRPAFERVFTRIVVMVGFLVLALSNLQGVLEVNRQRRILRSEIEALMDGRSHLSKIARHSVMNPPSDLETILFHLFFDGMILWLIWLIPTIESSKTIRIVNDFFYGLKETMRGDQPRLPR